MTKRQLRRRAVTVIAVTIIVVVAYWASMRTAQAGALGDQLAAHFKQIGLGIWHVITTVVTIIVDAFRYL